MESRFESMWVGTLYPPKATMNQWMILHGYKYPHNIGLEQDCPEVWAAICEAPVGLDQMISQKEPGLISQCSLASSHHGCNDVIQRKYFEALVTQ